LVAAIDPFDFAQGRLSIASGGSGEPPLPAKGLGAFIFIVAADVPRDSCLIVQSMRTNAAEKIQQKEAKITRGLQNPIPTFVSFAVFCKNSL
jgi:hypothetical protein